MVKRCQIYWYVTDWCRYHVQECLDIRSKYAPENDRLIAETHFQLGVAYSNVGNSASSNASFSEAVNILEKYKSKLESRLELMGRKIEDEKKDYDDLKTQIDDVAGLIDEVRERQKEDSEPHQAIEEPHARPSNLDVPVDDVSHLIKRKRSISSEEEVGPTKKPKDEDEVEKNKPEDCS